MPVVLLNSGTLWFPPIDCPAGTTVKVECWGPGSGASSTPTQGTGGGGGAYAVSNSYAITPNDVLNGIPFIIPAGGAGTSAAATVAPGDASWSNGILNLFPASTWAGVAVGTLPAGWSINTSDTNITGAVTAYGVNNGYNFFDFRLHGTATGSTTYHVGANWLPATAALTYTMSGYFAVVGGSTANFTNLIFEADAGTASYGYLGTYFQLIFTPTAALTRVSSNAVMPATTTQIAPYIEFSYNTGAVVDITLRIAGWQIELGSTLTPYKSTPGYTLAKGGAAHAGTTGPAGGAAAACVYATAAYSGGNGASYNAAGSGGGGAGGPAGNGNTGLTTGIGGSGDAGAGGAGGASQTTSPGNPGGSSLLGGGGGGALLSVSGIGGAGGSPGGGGGAATVSGTGGNGAGGAIQLTYTATAWPSTRQSALAPFMAS